MPPRSYGVTWSADSVHVTGLLQQRIVTAALVVVFNSVAGVSQNTHVSPTPAQFMLTFSRCDPACALSWSERIVDRHLPSGEHVSPPRHGTESLFSVKATCRSGTRLATAAVLHTELGSFDRLTGYFRATSRMTTSLRIACAFGPLSERSIPTILPHESSKDPPECPGWMTTD